jgi:ketosteroid isomerase-like protein
MTISPRSRHESKPAVGPRHERLLTVVLALLVCAGCATERAGTGTVEGGVRAVLDQQVRQWNAGDLDGFMQGYDNSPRTRFASGGDVNLGYQTVFDRYRNRYGDRAAMGTLTFSDVDITVLAPDAAVVFGRYRLQREKDTPSGLFTLLFRKTGEGWRIVHDHTSSAPTN